MRGYEVVDVFADVPLQRNPGAVFTGRPLAGRAVAPLDDLRLVDREAVIIGGVEARPGPHRTTAFDRPPTTPPHTTMTVAVAPTP